MKIFNTSLVLLFILLTIILASNKAQAIGALYARPRFSSDQYQKMWIKKVDAAIDIHEQIAVTHVDQTFHNEMNTSIEAIYIFPLPENATITELIYWVNGQRFVASIREKQQAANDYNQKLRQWMDPALLEYLGNNLFKLSIVPIDANSDVRTEITYVEPLQYDLGLVKYVFQLNTLQLSSKPLETVSVNLNAVSQYQFKEFFSPSHGNSSATKINKVSDNEYTLFYGDENYAPDKDLVVEFETKRDSVHFSLLTYTPVPEDSIGTDSYYAIWITPPDDLGDNEVIPKNIVFTADVSSSMEGLRLSQVKDALNNFLDLLNSNDKFNIITFGTFVDKFKPDLVSATTENITSAKDFVYQMYALGMTNIDQSLSESLNQNFGDSTSNDLVFLTDGKPTWGKTTNTDSILSNVSVYNKKNVRIFSFGVGTDVSRSFLTSLSNENHGYAQYIASDDSIALIVGNLFQRISKPVMTDIQIDMGGLNAWDQYPKTIGDLFWGSQIMELGMYNNLGTYNVTLKGKLRSKEFTYTKTINFADTLIANRFVPRLWAKAKIDDILRLIEIYGETDELVNQVIELGLKYQIITPYTSYYVDPNNLTSIASKDNGNKVTDQFTLEQNYPNPFNPSTIIGYRLSNNLPSYHVIIRIYNSLGQLVLTLVNEEKAPGYYQVTWDGRNSQGIAMPSGIYFYSIQAGNFRQVKKMILMR